MRDYGDDSTDGDERPPPVPDTPPAWDGWGEAPAMAAGEQPEHVQPDVREVRDVTPPHVPSRDNDWDGWGEPSTDRLVRTEHAELTPVEAERVHHEQVGATPARSPGDLALGDSDDEAHAREAVDAAFRSSSDISEGKHQASFDGRIGESDAYHAESLGEAEDYAREILGVGRVDYSEFDQRTANEVNATLEALRADYPTVGGLEYLGTIQGRNSDLVTEKPDLATERLDVIAEPDSNVVAQALRETDGYNGISINEQWAGQYDKTSRSLAEDEALGHSAAGTGSIRGATAHEYGHLIQYHLESVGQFEGPLQDAVDDLASHGAIQLSNEVSRYATASKAELFAETFAEYKCSATPRDSAQRIGMLVDEILRL